MAKQSSPIGIIFPLRHGKQGYFQQSYDDVTQARANIQNLLYTRIGERPMNPAFGSRLYNFIFDPVEIDQRLIENVIQEEVLYWIPNVSVESINIGTDLKNEDISDYEIYMQVNFIVNNTSGSAQLVFTP